MNKQWMDDLRSGADGDCPCCGRYAKVYKRKLHNAVARQLIMMLKLQGDRIFVHARDLIVPGLSGMGDLGKAQYWGLVEQKENNDEDQKSSGFWSLTERGARFVRGECKVPEYVMVFDNKVIERGGVYVSIHDAIGEKFSYKELMTA